MQHRLARALIAAALALAVSPAWSEAPARPPIAHFFEDAEFTGALLSPNAKFVAVRVGAKGKRQGLAMIDLASGDIAPVVSYSDTDIGDYQWISDKRLVFDTVDRKVGQGEMNRAPGVFAVNRDGSVLRQLVARDGDGWVVNAAEKRGMQEMLAWNHFLIPQRNVDDSEHVYLKHPVYEGRGYTVRHVELKRVNTVTGAASTVPRPEHTQGWVLDQKGEPRMAFSLLRDIGSVHYRDPATAQWRKLVSYNVYTGANEGFTPLAFGPGGTLFVEANVNSDLSAIHTFNFATGKVNPEPTVVTDKYDFDGELITNRDKVLGVRLTSDARTTVWFDTRMQALQKTVDALLPDTENLVSVAIRPETPWVLVEAYSDVRPRTFMLFNSATGAFRKIGSTHPLIDPAAMGRQQTVSYRARDGLAIPALLTLPPGSSGKNLPLVVLVHGGPFVRGSSWGWDEEAQFLATRGYAVLQPEFRGSTGFGYAHFQAGWKQWGLKMQDDIADGARWAIAQGIASPARICIAGASYGGYATLMGLVNDPALYRCGINWVGVTDIQLMYDGDWTFASDMPERYLKFGMPHLVGDPVGDAAQLKATSPLLQAARIRQPLLLAYGGNDRRVPAYHGEKFYQAVKQHNPDVEWVLYQNEGHGWHTPATRIDFWTRVEKFLDRHIGTP